MTVARMILAAFFALAAGIAVENAKARAVCPDDAGATCIAFAQLPLPEKN